MAQREGYVFCDHRASPGIPRDVAERLGIDDPHLVGEGKVWEAATVTCCHCRTVVIKLPDRIRERGSCSKCSGKYLCDPCVAESRLPGYIHTSFEQKVMMAKDAEAKGLPWNGFTPWLGSPPTLLIPK